ncbi:DUF1579 domain-containing protein [Bosea sp. PAMC 26642]|uniref:DUF1579 domain-containing protein n=1 Tax=Bosea sp. (strain PAMC 26642) TaxID=1792307 RepID=UPI000770038C|nr:DUF1579 domain-containing protein [Bosea sp. PAMC 26642]AMJ62522.1 hypothetical protein AXW83_21430 [Bosea sp. PAMC 26642]
MHAEPQKEHAWLQQFVGEWISEMDCSMGPDKPRHKSQGTESVHSLGGLWTIGEGTGEMPDGNQGFTQITLGFDPARGRFVGTFAGSMMTHLWIYEGTLDESGNVLTLDTEGPSMAGDGTMAKYRDVVTRVSADHRILTSSMPGPDGTWIDFMTAHYRRKA